MSTAPSRRLTVEEYLAIEERAQFRSEFYQGEMFAMSGAAWQHALIVGNLMGELRSRLRGRPCKAVANDVRVFVEATGLFTYPDVLVVCGERQKFRDREDTVVNPTVIFEVLSHSTEAYDRGRKFEQYQAISSLREYILVSQYGCLVERFARQEDDQWLLTMYRHSDEVVHLHSVPCELPLAEIYRDIEFPSEGLRLRQPIDEGDNE